MKGLYQVEYEVKYGKPIIYLYRRVNREKIVDIVENFLPYFYVDSGKEIRNDDVVKVENGFTSVYGDKVSKVVFKIPYTIYENRKNYQKTYEADILYTLRYLIDNVDIIEKDEYRINHVDIETTVKDGFPEMENPVQNITCITLYDNYFDKYYTLAWREDLIPKKEIVVDGTIFKFNNEITMLKGLIKLIKKLDPDILTAWNINFDMGYIVARMKYLGIDFTEFSPHHKVRVGDYGDISIKGRVVFDLLSAYRKINLSGLTSFSLDNVAQNELGEQKLKVVNFTKEWRENIDRLIKYNRHDVKLTVMIDDKLKIIDYFDEMRILAGLDNITSCFFYSRVIDVLMLRKYKNEFIFPSKGEYVKKEKNLEGGFVREPVKGLHKNVLTLDFWALYPSIIKTFNLSKEVVLDKKEKDCIVIDDVYLSKKKGIMPSLIDDLINLRAKYKTELEKYNPTDKKNYGLWYRKQFAAKFMVNTVYGVNALTNFRMYDIRIANLITFFGRELNKYIGKIAEKHGYKVKGGDSVSSDSPILVKDGDGLLHILPIKYIANFENDDTRKKSEFIEVFTRNGFKKIQYVKRHKVDKKMYRVWTRSGYVDATEDHSFFDNNKKELSPTNITKGILLETRDFELMTINIETIDNDTAWCLGYYLAEGSWLGKYQFVVNGNKKDLQEFKDKWKECSGILDLKEKNGCDRIGWLKRKELLKQCYIYRIKIVPSIILNASCDIQKSFLDGFYRGDGQQKSSRKEKERIDQKSKVLSMSLCYLYNRVYNYKVRIHNAGNLSDNIGMRFITRNIKPLNEVMDIYQISYDDYVYDISTEDGTFVTGVSPIVVHNTDSIFIQVPDDSKDVIKEGHELVADINSKLIDFVKKYNVNEHCLKLTFEKYHKSMLIGAKKRYATHTIWKEGKDTDIIDVVGFEVRRSDNTALAREMQKKVITDILKGVSMSDVFEYIVKVGKKIVCDKYTYEELALPSKLEKNQDEYNIDAPRIRGSKWSNANLGTNFKGGSKFLMLYVNKDRMGTDTLCFDNMEQLKVLKDLTLDYDKLLDVNIFMKLNTIFEVLGRPYDLRMLKGRVFGQKSLGEFV